MDTPSLGDMTTVFRSSHMLIRIYTVQDGNHIRAASSFGSLDCAFAIPSTFYVNWFNAEMTDQLSRAFNSMANDLEATGVDFPYSFGQRISFTNKDGQIQLVYAETHRPVNLNRMWTNTGDCIKTLRSVSRQLGIISECITQRMRTLYEQPPNSSGDMTDERYATSLMG